MLFLVLNPSVNKIFCSANFFSSSAKKVAGKKDCPGNLGHAKGATKQFCYLHVHFRVFQNPSGSPFSCINILKIKSVTKG